jgi:hypothetical protein
MDLDDAWTPGKSIRDAIAELSLSSELIVELPSIDAAEVRKRIEEQPLAPGHEWWWERLKDASGYLLDSAIPTVTIVKDGDSTVNDCNRDPEQEVALNAIIGYHQITRLLSGFTVEGLSPHGVMTSEVRKVIMRRAVLSGMPVVRVGRGNADGFTPTGDIFISGRNLPATKARLLLMACLMRHGALPPARDPDNPTDAEMRALRSKLHNYQAIFDTH